MGVPDGGGGVLLIKASETRLKRDGGRVLLSTRQPPTQKCQTSARPRPRPDPVTINSNRWSSSFFVSTLPSLLSCQFNQPHPSPTSWPSCRPLIFKHANDSTPSQQTPDLLRPICHRTCCTSFLTNIPTDFKFVLNSDTRAAVASVAAFSLFFRVPLGIHMFFTEVFLPLQS